MEKSSTSLFKDQLNHTSFNNQLICPRVIAMLVSAYMSPNSPDSLVGWSPLLVLPHVTKKSFFHIGDDPRETWYISPASCFWFTKALSICGSILGNVLLKFCLITLVLTPKITLLAFQLKSRLWPFIVLSGTTISRGRVSYGVQGNILIGKFHQVCWMAI